MLTPLKCPTGKKVFRTEAEAAPYVALHFEKEHPARAALVGVYRCPRCSALHIGHDRGWATLRTTRRGKHARVKSAPL